MCLTKWRSKNDTFLCYKGGPYCRQLFDLTCSKLFCSLFYIQLESLPLFYSSPELCTVTILCRIGPSQALMDLLHKLYYAKTCFYYQCDGLIAPKTLLCGDQQIRECRGTQPFARKINLITSSPRAFIAVQIDGLDGKRYPLSNSPYQIEELAREQGLLDFFGNARHAASDNSPQRQSQQKCKAPLYVEVEKLIETLQSI